MLSKTSKYAIKGVLYLALNSDEEHKVMARDISEPINVPASYISKLLQELVRHHIVSSTKGPGGGFYLTPENRQTPLIRIIEVLDGDYRLKSCMLSLKDCDDDRPCPMHRLLGAAKANLVRNLEEHTVEDLMRDIQAGKSHLPL